VYVTRLLKHLKKRDRLITRSGRAASDSGIARARADNVIALFAAAIVVPRRWTDLEAIADKERRRRLKSERNFASRLRNAMFSLKLCQAVRRCASAHRVCSIGRY